MFCFASGFMYCVIYQSLTLISVEILKILNYSVIKQMLCKYAKDIPIVEWRETFSEVI